MAQPDFTQAAMSALSHARERARQSGSIYVGTEHILLGLLKTNDTRLTDTLHHFDVDPAELARTALKYIEEGRVEISHDDRKRYEEMARMRDNIDTTASATAPMPDVAYSPNARKALVDTGEVAEKMHVEEIGAVHLLAALIKDDSNIAAQALTEHGLDYAKLLQMLQD
jgi:ATP-dependent Clp protease ATP-binding subunit ClpC